MKDCRRVAGAELRLPAALDDAACRSREPPCGSASTRVDEADDQGIVSLWLYVAGLCVTLSGLYAVNYGREEPAFATTTYAIAIARLRDKLPAAPLRVPYESLRLPLLVLVGLGLFAWLSTGQADASGDADAVS